MLAGDLFDFLIKREVGKVISCQDEPSYQVWLQRLISSVDIVQTKPEQTNGNMDNPAIHQHTPYYTLGA